jgi:hypothetical protein
VVPKHVSLSIVDLLYVGWQGEYKLPALVSLEYDSFVAVLKGISDYSKKFGSIFSDDWKFFVNLETLGGFLPSVAIEDFRSDIEDWVTGDVVHKSFDGKDWTEKCFLDDLATGMREFFDRSMVNVISADRNHVSLDEFCADPSLWAGSGSSQVKTDVAIRIGGEELKIRKNKWKTAAGLTSADVRSLVLDRTPQLNKAIQKRERGKVRAVINADDSTYLQMTYISLWLEKAMQGSNLSTLYMSREQVVDMWLSLSKTLGRNVRVPLDQSHFDWQQNKDMIAAFMDTVESLVSTALHSKDMLLVLDALRAKLARGNVQLGNDLIAISKGVMSGWRWTALMDTVFNYGEFHCAKQLCTRLGIPIRVESLIAQGDDDQVSVHSKHEALALVGAYAAMNFEINASKFFIAKDRDEYLRQVVVKGEVSGYPARGIGSIFWRNPVSRDPPAGLLRAREQITTWNTLIGRGCVAERVLRFMRMDICNANGLSGTQYEALLLTPASAGGLGLGITGRLALDEGTTIDEGVIVKARGIPRVPDGLQPSGWERRDELASWRGNLSTVKTSVKIREGEVKKVEINGGFRKRGYGSARAIPMSARNADDIPALYSEGMLKHAISSRDWKWIRDIWLDQSLVATSEHIQQKCGRRVWIDWLQGKLPFSVPVVLGYSQLFVSETHDKYANDYWSRLVTGSRRVNSRVVLWAAIEAEFETRLETIQTPIRLGG